MLRQLTEQISAHYSSSKIRYTHLRLFRPDRGPHTVDLARTKSEALVNNTYKPKKLNRIMLKVMLHGTIRNDDF